MEEYNSLAYRQDCRLVVDTVEVSTGKESRILDVASVKLLGNVIYHIEVKEGADYTCPASLYNLRISLRKETLEEKLTNRS